MRDLPDAAVTAGNASRDAAYSEWKSTAREWLDVNYGHRSAFDYGWAAAGKYAEAAAAESAAAERERIVKWLHAQAVELARDKPGLTDRQRSIRDDTSQSLIAAIAHMSALGLLDGDTDE